ncbi:TonB-dependent receptor [bacterium]|nr:TonB-dependent receptor [bacterium]
MKQIVIILLTCLAGIFYSWAQEKKEELDLTKLSLEELMSLEVTTASKKPQKLTDASASVFVLSGEEISRSGSRMIAEALRFCPGMEVSAIDANKWAISARGFGDRFANKLLVLMDGRSVYNSTFSGVYWDVQDFILEDIERIEIIRGPGASLWGANAVNGVINILTKSASETQGGLISGGIGNMDREIYGRYGFQFQSRWFGRSYIKHHSHENRLTISGDQGGDGWHTLQWGMRIDGRPGYRNEMTVQSDIYQGNRGRSINFMNLNTFEIYPKNLKGSLLGGNLLIRWQHTFSKQSEFILHSYIDYSDREAEELKQRYITGDINIQHRFMVRENHELIYGGEYRFTTDHLRGTPFTGMDPEKKQLGMISGFFQDEISLFDRRIFLTAGSKMEYNSVTGLEIQPTLRGLWHGTTKYRLWAAISRAVRTPSRAERDANILAAYSPPGNLAIQDDYPMFGRVVGQSGFDSETMIAYEMGYRFQPEANLYLDFSVYYNQYDRLRIGGKGETRLMGTPEDPYIEQLLVMQNGMACESMGLEALVDWNVKTFFRIRLIYSYLDMYFSYDQDYIIDGQVLADYTDEKSPDHQMGIWCSWNPASSVKLDVLGHYQSENQNIADPLNIHMNARLAWQYTPMISIALTGQNLWEAGKTEFISTFPGILVHNALSTKTPRSIFLQTCIHWH